ncbi:MAG: YciI family protein [Alphaproteobacteria bacterium]
MWYLVLRRPVKPREEWTVTLDQHLAWMKQQHEAGTILFSGPTTDRKYGIYVVKAHSKLHAEKIAAADPYTAAGFCAFEVLEWEVHQILGAGSFTAVEMRGHG